MRIGVIAPGAVPAATGGAERLYEGLVAAFNDLTPHEAELVVVPTPEHSFIEIVESYDTFRALDVSRFDLVVSTKYPSWMVRHEQHVVYMLHTLRGLYDTYHLFQQPTVIDEREPPVRVLADLLRATPPGTEGGAARLLATARWVHESLGPDHPACRFPGPLIRALVHWLDRDALDPSRVRAHFANSRRVTERAEYFPPGVGAIGLPHPTTLEGLRTGPYNSFFTASRLDGPKRIDLLIDAMEHVPGEVQLRIAGTGPAEHELRARRADDERIVFLGRISESQLCDEYANALAVPFVPLDEDMGLVTIEAQLAAKPVLTCTDSGGVTDLVTDGATGFIVPPRADLIGAALNRFVEDPSIAVTMGAAGSEAVREITWERVTNALLGPHPDRVPEAPPKIPPTRRPRRRSRVVMLSTYPAHPARGGGQLRLNRLARGLARRFDVDIITLDDAGGTPGTTQLGPRLRQIVVSKSEEHRAEEAALGARSPIPIGDVSASLFAGRTPELVQTIREAVRGAAVTVLEQPYMLPALRLADPKAPFIYDSQNAEFAMKRDILVGAPSASHLVAVVGEVERHAVQEAELVVTCSSDDRMRLEQAMPTLAPWALVPNGGDVLGSPFVDGDDRRRLRRLLVAALDRRLGKDFEHLALFVASYHPPNLEAGETIVDVASTLPGVAFVLAGSHSQHFVSWTLPRNVIPAGVVCDRALRRYLHSADVALNPIRSGGGTNLKLIEYFAAGAPVVSTPLGVRGVDVVDQQHLLLASQPAEFAAAIRSVLDDPLAASARARQARDFAAEHFDWSTLAGRFSDEIERVVFG